MPASLQNAISPNQREFPTVSITGYTSFGDRAPLYKDTETRSASVSLFKIIGNHQIKFGGEYRFDPENRAGVSPTNTATPFQISATSTYTVGPLSTAAAAPIGQALASLLYGIVGGSLNVPSTVDFAESNKVVAGFVQDDYKVTRKLNVNVGLRYEFETALTERFNRSVTGFDPAAALPFASTAQANYAKSPTPEVSASQFQVQGGLLFAGVNGQSRALYNPEKNEIMPRAGFAYNPNSKTVVRGGVGIFYGSLGVRLQDAMQTGFNQISNIVPTNAGGLTYASSLSNPFPNGIAQPTGSSLGALTYVGNPIGFFNQNPKAPQLVKYELDIQRELPLGFVVSAGYLGSRGYDLEVSRSYKPLPNQYLSTLPTRDQATINYLSANLPNPFFGIPQFAGTALSGSVISRPSLIAPYPQFSAISYYTYDGTSSYDALNVKAEKRFSHGYLVALTYSYSKFLQATSLLNAGDASPAKYISSNDFPNHLALSIIYDLPVGRGRQFLSHMGRVPEAILGGWNTSYIYLYQSGQALAFGDVLLTGDPHSVVLPASQRTAQEWFNTSVFNRVASQQLANNLITLSPTFSGARAAAYNSWDVSMIKHVQIHERLQMEVRADALNVLNQVTFAAPNLTPTSTSFGAVTAQMNVPRRLQFTVRLTF
jgi:hypothetical protein